MLPVMPCHEERILCERTLLAALPGWRSELYVNRGLRWVGDMASSQRRDPNPFPVPFHTCLTQTYCTAEEYQAPDSDSFRSKRG